MKHSLLLAGLITSFLLSSCTIESLAPKINTAQGVLLIKDIQFSERLPPDCEDSNPSCHKVEEGYQILIIWLELADDQGSLDINTMKFLNQEIYITSSDGSRTEASAAGFTPQGSYIAFTPASFAEGFEMSWPGNSPIALEK